ncbi:MAG TPA: hypothetical protein VFO01_06690 [Trebonia sp.]|nr:hypothetical protein [Trebonia sp.]
MPCSTCGKIRTVAARLPAGPLCSTCYRKDPASFRPCTGCGATERLYHHGLCIRCACREHLLGLLSHEQGGMHPHAEAIYHVLADSDPAPLMQWLTTSAAAGALADISRAGRPPGHAGLDRFPPGKAVRHLRKVLVASGILPARDGAPARHADGPHALTYVGSHFPFLLSPVWPVGDTKAGEGEKALGDGGCGGEREHRGVLASDGCPQDPGRAGSWPVVKQGLDRLPFGVKDGGLPLTTSRYGWRQSTGITVQ